MEIELTEDKSGEGMTLETISTITEKIIMENQNSAAEQTAAVSHAKPKAVKKAKTKTTAKPEQTALNLAPTPAPSNLVMMPLSLIETRKQVRTAFEEEALNELAGDIAANGVLQPILLRPNPGKVNFLVIAGERRLRAAKLAGLVEIPALVGECDDKRAWVMQLAENIQREELSLTDTATAVKKLFDEFGSLQAVCDAVRKSRAWVSKRLSLANGLNYYAAQLLNDGVTEDVETLKAVSDIEALGAGSNAAWALCERIRKGEAGRTEAREKLAELKAAKKQAQQVDNGSSSNPGKARSPEQIEADNKKAEADKRKNDLANISRLFWKYEEALLDDSKPSTKDFLDTLEDDYFDALDKYLTEFHANGKSATGDIVKLMATTNKIVGFELAAFLIGYEKRDYALEYVLKLFQDGACEQRGDK